MPATRSRRRIGILGGTFDPVHVGHLAIARSATEALALDELRFVPTARSWQKEAAGANAGQRCDMLRAAIGSTPGWQVDEREIRRGGASYTVDTLESLREELGGDAAIVLVLGSDQFRNLDTWHRYRELLRFAHIATTQRERVALADPPPAVAALLDAHGNSARHGVDVAQQHQQPRRVRRPQLAHRVAGIIDIGAVIAGRAHLLHQPGAGRGLRVRERGDRHQPVQ